MCLIRIKVGKGDHTYQGETGVGENLKEGWNHEAKRTNTRWDGEIDEVSGEC